MKTFSVLAATIAIISFSINILKAQEMEKFTDIRDGITYKTVKIGTQIWMAENLAYKTKIGSCAYKKDENFVATYGRLYTWEAAQLACPEGWHLPSEAEWKQLKDYLGGEDVAGEKLKSVSGWKTEEGKNYASNSSGFSALPGGWQHGGDENKFHDLGESGEWWGSNQPIAKYYVCVHYLYCAGIKMTKGERWITRGASVRCIKDN